MIIVLERIGLVWQRIQNEHEAWKYVLNSLRIKTQLKRLQRVIVVDSATHSQMDGVEGNGGSLEDGAEAFV